jgi:competence protein ComEA
VSARRRHEKTGGRWLDRADHAAAVVLISVALAAIAGYWFARGGGQGKWIEVDRAAPKIALFQVDVNRADWVELAMLPGIGETLARRIVEWREQNGEFQSVEQLSQVQGIGAKKLAAIRPYLLPTIADRGNDADSPRR